MEASRALATEHLIFAYPGQKGERLIGLAKAHAVGEPRPVRTHLPRGSGQVSACDIITQMRNNTVAAIMAKGEAVLNWHSYGARLALETLSAPTSTAPPRRQVRHLKSSSLSAISGNAQATIAQLRGLVTLRVPFHRG
jgi:hypothetical protein